MQSLDISKDGLDNQLVDLLEATRERIRCDELELEVSLFGGYNDEAGLSRRLSATILRTLQSSSVSFVLRHLCCGHINTVAGGPVVWGAALDLRTGAIFPAEFTRRLPDLDIRSLRLYSPGQKHLGRRAGLSLSLYFTLLL